MNVPPQSAMEPYVPGSRSALSFRDGAGLRRWNSSTLTDPLFSDPEPERKAHRSAAVHVSLRGDSLSRRAHTREHSTVSGGFGDL